jgi:hypothetical protein
MHGKKGSTPPTKCNHRDSEDRVMIGRLGVAWCRRRSRRTGWSTTKQVDAWEEGQSTSNVSAPIAIVTMSQVANERGPDGRTNVHYRLMDRPWRMIVIVVGSTTPTATIAVSTTQEKPPTCRLLPAVLDLCTRIDGRPRDIKIGCKKNRWGFYK